MSLILCSFLLDERPMGEFEVDPSWLFEHGRRIGYTCKLAFFDRSMARVWCRIIPMNVDNLYPYWEVLEHAAPGNWDLYGFNHPHNKGIQLPGSLICRHEAEVHQHFPEALLARELLIHAEHLRRHCNA